MYVPPAQISTLSSQHSSAETSTRCHRHTCLHFPPQPTALSIPPAPSPLLCTHLLTATLPPGSTPPLSCLLPPAMHTRCQIPSGSPEASCQAHTPFLAIPQMYFKDHVFSPLFPVCLSALQPFLSCPQHFCFFRSTFTSFSLPNLFGPFMTNSSIGLSLISTASVPAHWLVCQDIPAHTHMPPPWPFCPLPRKMPTLQAFTPSVITEQSPAPKPVLSPLSVQ